MTINNVNILPGLARYQAGRPLGQEIFTELIHKKAKESELALSSNNEDMIPWNLGLVSRKGNVRKRNEDYGIAFNHQNHQVMIMGDGLGGPSHGNRASYMAVEAATWVVLDHLKEGMTYVELQEVCAKAFWTASLRLAWMGDKLNVSHTGLRTTLIMLIANDEHAALTYIGDGAVYHYKSPTDCPSVLSAHKAIPGNLSLLSASLGPTVHGQPRSRKITRTKSDLFIVMSDGIADRITTVDNSDHPPELISNLVRLAELREGDLQKVAEESVETLTEEQDEKGYLCDDNITLGFIGNYKNPQLSQ